MAADLTPWPTIGDILPGDLFDTKKAAQSSPRAAA